MRLRSEQKVGSEKMGSRGPSGRLRGCQTERGSKADGNAEQRDGDGSSRLWTRIPSEPIFPGKTSVRALYTRQNQVCRGWRSDRRREADLDSLLPQQLHAGPPVFAAAPIVPEQRCRTNLERMEQHTDATGLGGGVSMPLALLAQGAIAPVAGQVVSTLLGSVVKWELDFSHSHDWRQHDAR